MAELSQEVADIVEERVVLEYQLDQLKSFGNQVLANIFLSTLLINCCT